MLLKHGKVHILRGCFVRGRISKINMNIFNYLNVVNKIIYTVSTRTRYIGI